MLLMLLMLLLLFQSAFKELLAMLVSVQTILTQLQSSVTVLDYHCTHKSDLFVVVFAEVVAELQQTTIFFQFLFKSNE
jgi:hypothetical protein